MSGVKKRGILYDICACNNWHTNLHGMETIAFVCLVLRVVIVRLSVH